MPGQGVFEAKATNYFLFLALLIFCSNSVAQIYGLPAIAIVIDDLGYHFKQGKEIVEFDGKIACSFLPFAPYSSILAKRARKNGKEIMLHMPMEAIRGAVGDPGQLKHEMDKQLFQATLYKQLDAIPGVLGVNNHMGSLLTQDLKHMRWTMDVLSKYKLAPLFFVDSRTTKYTVAEQTAKAFGLPTIRRHVFIDHVAKEKPIRKQFRRLVSLAKKKGVALGIAHPRAQTLLVLKEEISRLNSYGVQMVSVSELIEIKDNIK